MPERQQILHLWLAAAALDTSVTAWSFHDGAGRAGEVGEAGSTLPTAEPPYRTGLDAMADGWFLLQAPGPLGTAETNGELACEFIFERRVEVAELPS